MMSIEHIPKSFWNSLSFCMIVATLGIIYIAYKSSSVSIEIANAKIELSSVISQTKELKTDLEIENDSLLAANKDLEDKLSHLEGTLSNNENARKAIADIKESRSMAGSGAGTAIRDPQWFDSLDMKIQSAEQALY